MALTKITSSVIESGGIEHSNLADSGVTAGSYGSSSQVPVITVTEKGIITSVTNTAVAGVDNVTFDSATGVLTIDTSDGSSYTTDIGVGTSDSPTFAGATFTDNISLGDGNILRLGNSNDLQIQHFNDENLIRGGKPLTLWGKALPGANAITLGAVDATYATFEWAAGASLYYDNSVKFETTNTGIDVTGNIVVSGTVDGRDVAADGTKLDGIESGADVTDTANVTAAGALMDSELTSITAVKALDQGVATTDSPSFANLNTTGYLRGPATFTIDPAAHGDDTGTVVIAGNLQVDGTTTTINSTTVTIDDKTLVLGENTTSDAEANGSAVVFGGHTNPASIYYNGTLDRIGVGNVNGIEATTFYGALSGTASNSNLLDNLDSSQFLRSNPGYSFSTGFSGDIDTLHGISFVRNYATGGGTHAFGYHHNVFSIPNTNSSAWYNAQLAFETSNSGGSNGGIKWRSIGSSSSADWSDWFKIWHENNDGAGSGLDADTVDGLQASQFLRSDASDTVTGHINFDNDNGIRVDYGTADYVWYKGYGIESNRAATYLRPTTDNTQILYIGGSDASLDWNLVNIKTGSSTGLQHNGNTVWTAANDGSGSGLDADTVDGLQASQFLRGDTSDAMTGVLEITGTDARPLKLSRPGLTNTTIQFSSNTGDTYLGIFNEGELGIGSNADVIGTGNRILTTADEGTGNGLDADTVDGIQAASFLRSDATDSLTGLVHIDRTGELLYAGSSTDVDKWIKLGNYGSTAEWMIKFVGSTSNEDGNELRFESSWTGKYVQLDHLGNFEYFDGTSTHKVWTGANDGSGSGLDADLLDGLDSSQFLRSDVSDTMTGNLGIGTAPAYTFEVNKDAGTGLISRIYNSNADGQGLLIRAGATTSETRVLQLASANDTKIMTVNSNGRVGIGTTSPRLPVEVNAPVSSGTQTGASVSMFLSDTTTATQGLGGGIGFAGSVTGYTEKVCFGTINGIHENSDLTKYDGSLTFKTRAHAGALTEKVRITSTGNVGIGTSTPGEKLSIQNGNIGFLTTDPTNIQPGLYFNEGTTYADQSFRIIHDGAGGGEANLLKIQGDGAGTGGYGDWGGITVYRNGSVYVGGDEDLLAQEFGPQTAQLMLGGAHNANFNTYTKAKLYITGMDNDTGGGTYILCESENNTDEMRLYAVSPSRSNLFVNGSVQLNNTTTYSALSASEAAGSIAYITDDGGNLAFKSDGGWRVFTARPGSSAAPIVSSGDFAGGEVVPGMNWFALNGQTFQAYVTDSFEGASGWWVRCNYSATTWEYNAGGSDGANHWNVTNSSTSGRATFELTDAQIDAVKTITSAAWLHFSRGCYGSVGWSYSGNTPGTGNAYVGFKWWDNTQVSPYSSGTTIDSNLQMGGGTAWSTSASTSDCDANDTTWRREEYYIYTDNTAGLAKLPIVDYANNDSGDASEMSRIYGADSQIWFKVF